MTAITEEILSPCNDKCDVNDDDICTGCFRSFVEVLTWSKVDATTREFFMLNIEERKKAYNNNPAVKVK